MQNLDKVLEKAKEISAKGDKLRQEGEYEQAALCYSSVTKILKAISKQIQNVDTLESLRKKIVKYQQLQADMQKQNLEKRSKKTKIISFGFPEVPKPNPFMAPPPPIKKQAIQNKTNPINQKKDTKGEVKESDPHLGLLANNIKVGFDDIVGMAELKETLYEAVIIPQKRPDLFEGIRSPPRGILLYGPPGNGKTFITKALAKESKCTFYGLSAGSILNKFVGESEKTLRKVFESAKKTSPAIIFIDEIDSMLTARSESENDASRRLKTEFLVQFDNLEGSQVIVIGATNLPNELDLAALRRFNKLVYVGMPDKESRHGIVQKTLKQVKSDISSSEMNKLVRDLEGYSASEITDIVKEASMIPIRQINKKDIQGFEKSKIRAVRYEDFQKVIKNKKPLLSKQDLKKYQGKFK